MGDFNCRVGSTADNIPVKIHFNNVLSRNRCTQDPTHSSRGSMLAKVLLEYGLIILNGRTETDPTGGYTYLHLLSGALSFGPRNMFISHVASHHRWEPTQSVLPKEIFRPKPILMAHYNAFLSENILKDARIDPDNLVQNIKCCARELNMAISVKHKVKRKREPWYDTICSYFHTCFKRALREIRKRDST